MDYRFCYYKGRYVYSASEYLSAIRGGFFNIIYDPKNRKKMIEEIDKSIDYYSSVDLYALAAILYDENTESSLSRAYAILDMIVSWDYVPAKHLLALMYFHGAGVQKDLNKFYDVTLQAANAGYILSKNSLALAYFNGYGCRVDLSKGHELLQECVDAHYGMAYFNLGIGHYNGSYGYSKNLNKAFEYYKEASNQFNKQASYRLGLMYLAGEGCTKNVEKGIYELVNAAQLGYLKAQIRLGDIYYFGEVTTKDYEKAYSYYLMAAENGDPYSMYSVGFMIINKQKASVERYDGIQWLQKAAYLGDESAEKLLKSL